MGLLKDGTDDMLIMLNVFEHRYSHLARAVGRLKDGSYQGDVDRRLAELRSKVDSSIKATAATAVACARNSLYDAAKWALDDFKGLMYELDEMDSRPRNRKNVGSYRPTI